MELSDFLRIYQLRAPQIMWFLGAGASVAARVPSAYDIIWDCKRWLYCSAQRLSLRGCDDLSNPILRAKIQRYCDTLPGVPAADAEEEYSYYFERAFPSESDRRKYIEKKVSGAKPSFGHLALATLFKLDRARLGITTNFDRNIEDSAATVLGGSGRMITAAIENADVAMQALNEGRWPLLIKLHGDFQSRRLKNTSDELRSQNTELQHALVQGCARFGLAVVGYSGRDHSVMDALEQGLHQGRGFPSGLFWFRRSDSPILPRVRQLIDKAHAVGVEAELIEMETFDELLGDVLRLTPDLPEDAAKVVDSQPRRLTPAPVPAPTGSWPLLRLNAFPIVVSPTTCRKVVCEIGGYKEVRDAVAAATVQVIAARREVGVIAFGRDEDVKKAFQPFNIKEFSLHSIEPRRLRYESAELGMLYDALALALARDPLLEVYRRSRSWMVTVNPTKTKDPAMAVLRKVASPLAGTVPGTTVGWREAARIKLAYKLDQLWMIFEPAVWFDHTDDAEGTAKAKEFVRERQAARYNPAWNNILDGWTALLFGDGAIKEFRAFGISDGIDAVFRISKRTAYSLRGSGR